MHISGPVRSLSDLFPVSCCDFQIVNLHVGANILHNEKPLERLERSFKNTLKKFQGTLAPWKKKIKK